jgi:hypothetical protein
MEKEYKEQKQEKQEKLRTAKFARTQEGELYKIVGMYGKRDTDFNDACFQLRGLNDMLNDKLYSVGGIYLEEYQSRLETGEELVDLLHKSDIVELAYSTIYNEKVENIFIVASSGNIIYLVSSNDDFSYNKTEKKWYSYRQSKVLDIISIMPYEKYKNNSYIIKESKDNEQSK